ncbi:MAG: PDDEXK nuclease domain-containing protein [Bifidobacteriaceae bacterium]|nr:PDDEXK nuclease domain-containing protein [Bifidobacteriaceae bacterium]
MGLGPQGGAAQRRLRLNDTWFRVDLVFYHRQLRGLVLIDLKRGRPGPGVGPRPPRAGRPRRHLRSHCGTAVRAITTAR